MSRLGNGTGSVYKLSGNRKKPWTARKTIGFKLNGQPIYRYIGYYRTKAEAMTALMEYNKAPYSLEGERLCDMYEGFMNGYMDSHSEGSINNTRTAWKHLEPLQNASVSNLTRKQLQLFFDGLEVSEVVKKRVKMLLKQILDYSIRYDVIQPERIVILDYIDISSKIPTQKVNRSVFSSDEIERLEKMDDDFAQALLFLIYTGIRPGEFSSIKDGDIDENYVLHIGKSKTAAGIRSVPLSKKAQNLLPLPHFTNYKVMNNKYFIWKKEKGIDHTLHDTRHTCISMLANAGVDKRIIQAIVGHKGTDVTDGVYTHIGIEVMREALNKI